MARMAAACIRASELTRADLERVAEALLGLGPTVAIDDAMDRMGVVWVDGVGVPVHGRRAFAEEVAHTVGRLVERAIVRVVMAGGPRIAKALAVHARVNQSVRIASWVVAEGKDRAAVRALPIEALELSKEARALLSGMGLSTVGDVADLPRSGLGIRLGHEMRALSTFLDGEDAQGLRPYVPKERPEESMDLDEGIEAHEPLGFVVHGLCSRMAARLLGRGVGAAKVELELRLDRAIARIRGVDAHVRTELSFSACIFEHEDLFAVLRARIVTLELPAPVRTVILRVMELGRRDERELSLFVPEAKAERALPRLVAELVAEYGEGSVGVLSVQDAWEWSARSKLSPWGEAGTEKGGASAASRGANLDALLCGDEEPTRIWTPVPIDAGSLHTPAHPTAYPAARSNALSTVHPIGEEFLGRFAVGAWWNGQEVTVDRYRWSVEGVGQLLVACGVHVDERSRRVPFWIEGAFD